MRLIFAPISAKVGRNGVARDGMLVVFFAVPAPLAALAFLGAAFRLFLGGVSLLLGARITTSAFVFLRRRRGEAGWSTSEATRPAARATGAKSARATRATKATGRTAARPTAGTAEGTWSRCRTRRTWHAFLRLLDEDVAAREHVAIPLFDRGLGICVRANLDERESTRPLRLAIERDSDAEDRAAVQCERIAQLWLCRRVRKITYKQLRAHPAFSCSFLRM